MHVPVLKKEVLELLRLKEGNKVVDATLGLGGHSEEMLKMIGEEGRLYAFERDERNLREAKKRLKDFSDQIRYFHTNFVSLKTCPEEEETADISPINAILFDLGLSSPHVDDPSRGFSYKEDGPLDMRFDSRQKLTAGDIVNNTPEKDLVEIFSRYGEERASKKVAKAIASRRKEKIFQSTVELAEFIRELKKKFPVSKDHAAQVFQALRIAVNNELEDLKKVLPDAIDLLAPGGRLAVISYHSLEDRIVKNIFRDYSKDLEDPDEPFIHKVIREKKLKLITKKPIVPPEEEKSLNPRARSAKLRVVEKLPTGKP